MYHTRNRTSSFDSSSGNHYGKRGSFSGPSINNINDNNNMLPHTIPIVEISPNNVHMNLPPHHHNQHLHHNHHNQHFIHSHHQHPLNHQPHHQNNPIISIYIATSSSA